MGNLRVTRLGKNCSLYIEPEDLLASSRQSAKSPCPDADELIPHPHIQWFIVSILILPYHLPPDIQRGVLPSAFMCMYFLCLTSVLHLTGFCQPNIFSGRTPCRFLWVEVLQYNEELNDLYSSPNIVRVVKSRLMRWARHVARMGDDRVVQRVLVGKPEGKRPLGRPRLRWEDNTKMTLQEVGGGRGDWMELAQDRDRWRALVGTVRDFWVP